MFDIGWTEIAIITVVALVVIGPKDLPGVVRSIGRWTGKARKVTRDFQRNFETMAEETELADFRRVAKEHLDSDYNEENEFAELAASNCNEDARKAITRIRRICNPTYTPAASSSG